MNLLPKTICFVMLMVFTTSSISLANESADNKAQKAVLITGATTGIGRMAAEMLAKEGYFIYAGARKQKDIDALNKIPNIQAVKLDVTVQEQIDAAVETIRSAGRGLYGLVNNAGVASGGPVIEQDVNDMRWLFDINVFGVVNVTQAFAPMIIESNGRIVNIGSISGILTWPTGADYTMSKHAVGAFSETLGIEMARFGVKVSVIEPGNFNSNIGKSVMDRRDQMTEAQKQSPYADLYESMYSGTGDRSQYREPVPVVNAIRHALFDQNPRIRYMVTPNQNETERTIAATLRRVAQRNEQQEFAYSREQLIEMLDEAIAAENQQK